MVRNLIYSLLILSFIGCKSSLVYVTPTQSTCELDLNNGVNGIKPLESTLDDVKAEFGDVKIRKTWVKAVEMDFGHYERYICYTGIGCFYQDKKDKKGKKNHSVTQIVLDSTSTCITKVGLGLGTEYQNWIETFPNIDYTTKSSIPCNYQLVYYQNPTFEVRSYFNKCEGEKVVSLRKIVITE